MGIGEVGEGSHEGQTIKKGHVRVGDMACDLRKLWWAILGSNQ